MSENQFCIDEVRLGLNMLYTICLYNPRQCMGILLVN